MSPAGGLPLSWSRVAVMLRMVAGSWAAVRGTAVGSGAWVEVGVAGAWVGVGVEVAGVPVGLSLGVAGVEAGDWAVFVDV